MISRRGLLAAVAGVAVAPAAERLRELRIRREVARYNAALIELYRSHTMTLRRVLEAEPFSAFDGAEPGTAVRVRR